jgi:hypothetical protein
VGHVNYPLPDFEFVRLRADAEPTAERIGRDLNLPRPQGMTAMLNKLDAEAGLEIAIEEAD